jgi:hypothetical protein
MDNMHPTRIFKTPEELEKAFKEYKENLKEEAKEWVKIQYVGKDGDRVADPLKLPYTQDGFEVWCKGKYGCVHQYFDNKDNLYTDFVTICSYIKKEIRNNQITGGLLGVYNPSVTQRLNGLKESQETQTSGEIIVKYADGVNPA